MFLLKVEFVVFHLFLEINCGIIIQINHPIYVYFGNPILISAAIEKYNFTLRNSQNFSDFDNLKDVNLKSTVASKRGQKVHLMFIKEIIRSFFPMNPS